jgi:hypothetical protein
VFYPAVGQLIRSALVMTCSYEQEQIALISLNFFIPTHRRSNLFNFRLNTAWGFESFYNQTDLSLSVAPHRPASRSEKCAALSNQYSDRSIKRKKGTRGLRIVLLFNAESLCVLAKFLRSCASSADSR